MKADTWCSFGVYAGEESGSWTNLNYANYSQSASPDWETKTISFSAFAVFSLHKLSFDVGGSSGTYYFDNIVLEKVNAKIEIIGSSVAPYDWSAGIDMPGTDDIHYSLSNYYLKAGMVKFRQNKDWSVNWGNIGFPLGDGFQGAAIYRYPKATIISVLTGSRGNIILNVPVPVQRHSLVSLVLPCLLMITPQMLR